MNDLCIRLMELQFYVFLPGFYFVALILTLSIVLFLSRKTRRLAKRLAQIAAVAVCIGGLYYAAVNKVREHYARSIIEKARPVVEALASFQRERGSYPATLAELVPKYLKEIPKTTAADLGYERTDQGFYLRFGLPGPVFGSHFFYMPSKQYDDWRGDSLQLNDRIEDWGWYLKV